MNNSWYYLPQAHRSLMSVTWLLTIAATVLIFLYKGGWTSTPLMDDGGIHALVGIASIGEGVVISGV